MSIYANKYRRSIMPLVTISLSKAWSIEDQKLIADGIHEAIVGVGFPQADRFQKIHNYVEAEDSN
jgi:hypothetical protein